MLSFRPYKNCDADTIVTWIKDEKTLYQWSADIIGIYPLMPENLNHYYEERKNNPDFMVFTACDENNIPVGHMFMKYRDDSHKVLRFGFVIVDAGVRGKGYGKEMLTIAKKYAFDFLHADVITLGVFANNPNALSCYQAAGFQEFGERIKYMIQGEEWEDIEMKCER